MSLLVTSPFPDTTPAGGLKAPDLGEVTPLAKGSAAPMDRWEAHSAGTPESEQRPPIPLAEATDPARRLAEAKRKKKVSVLVVESDLTRAAVIADVLFDAPAVEPIVWVYYPRDAFAVLARGFVPMVVLLGSADSDKSGRALIRRLGEDPRFSRTTVLATSCSRPIGVSMLALAIRGTIASNCLEGTWKHAIPWRAKGERGR